jgi:hypothetical protein
MRAQEGCIAQRPEIPRCLRGRHVPAFAEFQVIGEALRNLSEVQVAHGQRFAGLRHGPSLFI